MRVGVNYPWFDYGWDFGRAPAGWRGGRTAPRWQSAIDEHLRHFRRLGISVVRWFILADGFTYGTGAAAPRPDPSDASAWRFEPPSLSADVLQHFDELLDRFEATGETGTPPIQLLPVLIDFHFCDAGTRPVERPDPVNPVRTVHDPGWVKQGRADALTDPRKRQRFLEEALEPLLAASRRHAEVIYAWEIINEPDWVTSGWHSSPVAQTPVPQAAMLAFLEEAKQRIRAAGFKPTIGFASSRTLQRSGITTEINQFHHYPDGAARLERHTFDPRFPGIIGEFATAVTDVWPELVGGGQGLLHRLRLAESLGYPLAIPWSFLARDRHSAWTAAAEQELVSFVRG